MNETAMGEAATDPPASGPVGVDGDASWWTAERASLFEWLRRTAPSLAPVYRAAALMALDDGFPGRVWLVAHAVREIRNRLPDALVGEIESRRTDYKKLTEEVDLRWRNDGMPPVGATSIDAAVELSAAGAGRREVSGELLKAVEELLLGHLQVNRPGSGGGSDP